MCKNKNESIDRLYKITGQMLCGLNQPSQYSEDWKLPKTTPITALRKIEEECSKAHMQLIEWVIEIRKIIELIDPHNKVIHLTARPLPRVQPKENSFSRPSVK